MRSIPLVLVFINLLLFQFVSAGVVKSDDKTHNCTLYRATDKSNPAQPNESEVVKNEAYGFSVQNLEIDFPQKIATVDLLINITLGFDRKLNQQKLIVSPDNPQFTFIINQLNRVLFLFDSVCISSRNELIYVTRPAAP